MALPRILTSWLKNLLSKFSNLPGQQLSVRANIQQGEVTPVIISKALKQFINGDASGAELLFNRMTYDEHLEGIVSSRLSATSGLNLDFASDEESDAVEGQREFLHSVFKNIQVDDLIEDILEAKLRLFKVLAPDWTIENSQFVLKGYRALDNSMFSFDQDDIYFKTAAGRKEPFAQGNEWYYAVKVRSKKAIYLRCLKPYMIKSFGYDSWVHFIEVFSDPFRIGYYPDGSNKEIINQVYEAVYNMGQDGAAAMPMGSKMEFIENSRTGDQTFAGLVAACEAGLSKAVLGHSAAADATPGKLGQDENALMVRKDLAMADRRFALRWLYAGFIRPLLIFNFAKPAEIRPVLTENVVISRDELRTSLRQYWEMGGEVDPVQFEKMGVLVQENAPLLKRSTDFVL